MDFQRIKYHFDRVGIVPKVFLDIGANKGQWYLECKKHFNVEVFMVEANEDNLSDLLKAGSGSGNDNISVVIALLGKEEKDSVPFYKAKMENNTGNSIFLENSVYFKEHNVANVKMTTLDKIIGVKYNHIDLIKLDVQGAELEILEGGKDRVIPRCDLILMEVAFQQYNKGAPLAPEVFNYMNNLGFQAIDMLEQHHFGNDFIQADFLFARKDSKFIKDKFGY